MCTSYFYFCIPCSVLTTKNVVFIHHHTSPSPLHNTYLFLSETSTQFCVASWLYKCGSPQVPASSWTVSCRLAEKDSHPCWYRWGPRGLLRTKTPTSQSSSLGCKVRHTCPGWARVIQGAVARKSREALQVNRRWVEGDFGWYAVLISKAEAWGYYGRRLMLITMPTLSRPRPKGHDLGMAECGEIN